MLGLYNIKNPAKGGTNHFKIETLRAFNMETLDINDFFGVVGILSAVAPTLFNPQYKTPNDHLGGNGVVTLNPTLGSTL